VVGKREKKELQPDNAIKKVSSECGAKKGKLGRRYFGDSPGLAGKRFSCTFLIGGRIVFLRKWSLTLWRTMVGPV